MRDWHRAHCVLIESDWNLKKEEPIDEEERQESINRIRLEFKGLSSCRGSFFVDGINRIRLEFKVLKEINCSYTLR